MRQRAMVGHMVANSLYVAAGNRVGREAAIGKEGKANFYGSSFIADATGTVISEAGRGQTIAARAIPPGPTRCHRDAGKPPRWPSP
jgi:predicted amidohydrolase